jgi:hypothetical protein
MNFNFKCGLYLFDSFIYDFFIGSMMTLSSVYMKKMWYLFFEFGLLISQVEKFFF